MPQRGIEEVVGGILPAAFSPALVASGHFLRCPAGARSQTAGFPGAASAGADLPPANLLRSPSGTGAGRSCPQHVRSLEVVGILRRSFPISRAATGTVALHIGCSCAALCSSLCSGLLGVSNGCSPAEIETERVVSHCGRFWFSPGLTGLFPRSRSTAKGGS